MPDLRPAAAATLSQGVCIPAHPLAVTESGDLDREAQSALTCYYLDAGAEALAVGVHTTQFEIREHGLYREVLELAAVTCVEWGARPVLIAGVCGPTEQACWEAEVARELGYDLAMVSLRGLDGSEEELVRHVREVGEVLPAMGFYLQAAVGGRPLSSGFWRELANLECVRAIKIAPFNRYATLDVVRGVAQSGRAADVALYTGNDDNIVVDLLTVYEVHGGDGAVRMPIVGSLLGQNAVGYTRAREIFIAAQQARVSGMVAGELLTTAARLTDFNAAVFDVAGDFKGCIIGVNEVLVRDGLLATNRLLDADVTISESHGAILGQALEEFSDLRDVEFVRARRPVWRAVARRAVSRAGCADAAV